jgi:hypothetical protein
MKAFLSAKKLCDCRSCDEEENCPLKPLIKAMDRHINHIEKENRGIYMTKRKEHPNLPIAYRHALERGGLEIKEGFDDRMLDCNAFIALCGEGYFNIPYLVTQALTAAALSLPIVLIIKEGTDIGPIPEEIVPWIKKKFIYTYDWEYESISEQVSEYVELLVQESSATVPKRTP